MITSSIKLPKNLDRINARANDLRPVFLRGVVPYFKLIQQQRWMSQGGSQNSTWKPLQKKYEDWKLKLFRVGKFPKKFKPTETGLAAHGSKMMILSGRTFDSAIGGKPFGVQMTTEKSLFIGIQLNAESQYIKYVDKKRKIFSLNAKTKQEIKAIIKAYIASGKIGNASA